MRAENMYRGGQGKNVKGKNQYIPGMPKKKAQQHPIDESGPPIKVPKIKKNHNTAIENEKSKEVVDWLNGWNTPALQEVIKQQLRSVRDNRPTTTGVFYETLTEEQELLLELYNEHGLHWNSEARKKVGKYLTENNLI